MNKLTSNLEDQFFFKKDLELLEKHRALKKMRETKEAIKAVSGINDDTVVEKLFELNIRPETVASLAVVPLVEVAWANGAIGQKEKEAVLAAVTKFGWSNTSVDYVLLQRWLEHKPDPALLEAWVHYIKNICAQMQPDEIIKFKTEILSHSNVIAAVSGGILGLGTVSDKERKILETIENAFNTSCTGEK